MERRISMETTLTRDYVLRDAGIHDAEQLARFFQVTYGNSSHECQDEDHVRDTIERQTTSWFVSAQGERLLACAANTHHAWNRTYETCRIFAWPDVSGRGLGRRLYLKALDRAYSQTDCDMQWGTPRSHGVYLMVRRGLDTPAILVGHDGGMHVANGEREYHIVTVTRNPNRPIPRVIPPGSFIAASPFITDQIVSHLSFRTEVGEYPYPYIVGPPGEQRAAAGECVFFYDYDAASPSQSLQITNVAAPRPDTDCVASALATFLTHYPSVKHVSAYVLVDKEDLICRMRDMGFAVTAYLPAWYFCDEKRYDCVMLVRRSFSEEPVAHGMQALIALFDAHLNGFF
jgi:GNAT superfamily N-acetyltransferase